MNARASDHVDEGLSNEGHASSDARPSEHFAVVVDESAAGQRLDAFLAAAIPTASRSRVRRGIDNHLALVEGAPQRASYRVSAGERIEITVPPSGRGA